MQLIDLIIETLIKSWLVKLIFEANVINICQNLRRSCFKVLGFKELSRWPFSIRFAGNVAKRSETGSVKRRLSKYDVSALEIKLSRDEIIRAFCVIQRDVRTHTHTHAFYTYIYIYIHTYTHMYACRHLYIGHYLSHVARLSSDSMICIRINWTKSFWNIERQSRVAFPLTIRAIFTIIRQDITLVKTSCQNERVFDCFRNVSLKIWIAESRKYWCATSSNNLNSFFSGIQGIINI